MATQENISKTTQSVERVQDFDPKSIARRDDLGKLNFEEAIPNATSVVNLFNRINKNALSLFSENQLNQIRTQSDAAFNLLNRFTTFDPATSGNAAEERRGLIAELKGVPEVYIDNIAPHISYSVASSLDPTATQQEMRAIIQRFHDERDAAIAGVEQVKSEAQEVLDRVRAAAAEQGVSQQASYFRAMAEEHNVDSKLWLKYSIITGSLTLLFAVIAAFSYRIPWIAPKNNVEVIQLVTSKLVILSILAYGLVTCVRNFLSHKHNSVVNRHRQNALLTYTAFVDAAPSTASREIVLTHAAASVFSPQETGYIKNEEPAGARSVMEMITKASMPDKGHG